MELYIHCIYGFSKLDFFPIDSFIGKGIGKPPIVILNNSPNYAASFPIDNYIGKKKEESLSLIAKYDPNYTDLSLVDSCIEKEVVTLLPNEDSNYAASFPIDNYIGEKKEESLSLIAKYNSNYTDLSLVDSYIEKEVVTLLPNEDSNYAASFPIDNYIGEKREESLSLIAKYNPNYTDLSLVDNYIEKEVVTLLPNEDSNYAASFPIDNYIGEKREKSLSLIARYNPNYTDLSLVDSCIENEVGISKRIISNEELNDVDSFEIDNYIEGVKKPLIVIASEDPNQADSFPDDNSIEEWMDGETSNCNCKRRTKLY